MARRLLPILLLLFAGCSASATKTGPGKTAKSGAKGKGGKRPVVAQDEIARLMPADTVLYYRVRNVKKVVERLIQPKHVKDAAKVQMQVNRLIAEVMLSLSEKQTLGLTGNSLMSLFFDIETVHFGMTLPDFESGSLVPEFVAVIRTKAPASLSGVMRDLAKTAKPKTNGDRKLLLRKPPGAPPMAAARLNATTLMVGTERAVESGVQRKQNGGGKSLADSPGYRQAIADWGNDGELFVFADLNRVRAGVQRRIPFASISHAALSLRIDGGLAVRAYAARGKRFPAFLVRTPSERRFLSRIPADAAFILGTGAEPGKTPRKNFVEWVTEELGREQMPGVALLPERWRTLAEAYAADPKRVENEAFVVIRDIWEAALPIRSESAFFIAPDAHGRWGTAFLFDIADRKQVAQLKTAIFESPERARLPWKTTDYQGLTIRYVDFAEIAKRDGRTIPPDLAKQAQLQVGYAEGKELFFVGTLEAIKFAHKPTGKTLDKELAYDNLDAKNAILLSLQPGRVLHRTFGVPQVDRLLKAFASQIPEESNYAVTLNFAPKELTLRTNIPFVSLFVWLAMEMQGKGPAKLHEFLHSPSVGAPVPAPRPRE